MSGTWWVYMIECRGGKIYTGIAMDPEARYRQHLSGNGAAFTRINPPVALLAKRLCGSRSDALKEERALRRLTGKGKRAWAEKPGPSPWKERSVTP
jgi:putative endonuclease